MVILEAIVSLPDATVGDIEYVVKVVLSYVMILSKSNFGFLG